ncbi:MAG: flagellar brake protein [Burkholderiales bacterium]|nr:flagellar brake protein [Burkholderiales bacterium]
MPASLSDDEIADRYFLLGRMEILNALNDLILRREPVTVYFNGGRDFILTILLEARSDALVFDLGADKRANKILAHIPSCVFVAVPDGIRVQFTGQQPTRFTWGESDAFRVPLPDRIIRLQRRECYRNILPLMNNLQARFSDAADADIGTWPMHDLSVGGFAVTTTGMPPLKPGDLVPRIRIALSAKSKIDCIGSVRHVTQIEHHGQGRYRVGVAFSGLPHVLEVAIQRYIIKIEYERRKLLMK